MKKIRWSPDAADDLVRIIEYIRKDNDAAAQRIARVALQRIASLKQFPQLGRAGRVNEPASCRFHLFPSSWCIV